LKTFEYIRCFAVKSSQFGAFKRYNSSFDGQKRVQILVAAGFFLFIDRTRLQRANCGDHGFG